MLPLLVLDGVGTALLALGLLHWTGVLALLPPATGIPEGLTGLGLLLVVLATGLLLRRLRG